MSEDICSQQAHTKRAPRLGSWGRSSNRPTFGGLCCVASQLRVVLLKSPSPRPSHGWSAEYPVDFCDSTRIPQQQMHATLESSLDPKDVEGPPSLSLPLWSSSSAVSDISSFEYRYHVQREVKGNRPVRHRTFSARGGSPECLRGWVHPHQSQVFTPLHPPPPPHGCWKGPLFTLHPRQSQTRPALPPLRCLFLTGGVPSDTLLIFRPASVPRCAALELFMGKMYFRTHPPNVPGCNIIRRNLGANAGLASVDPSIPPALLALRLEQAWKRTPAFGHKHWDSGAPKSGPFPRILPEHRPLPPSPRFNLSFNSAAACRLHCPI